MQVAQKGPDIEGAPMGAGSWDHATGIQSHQSQSRVIADEGYQQVVPGEIPVNTSEAVQPSEFHSQADQGITSLDCIEPLPAIGEGRSIVHGFSDQVGTLPPAETSLIHANERLRHGQVPHPHRPGIQPDTLSLAGAPDAYQR